MKSFLAFLVAMGIIVTLSDAYCFGVRQIPERPFKGCEMNGKLYPFGHIERTEDCHTCFCSKHFLDCCSLFHTPVAYDQKNCKVIFNKKRCDYDVVQRDDPSKMCNSPHSRVG
ncbi:beta-microseminoprotein-like [Chamaea fasciata]|uniref:beta-microseminoprotein-like n=1 Tax=Chamaea fasciata TaxID=190680 RepID=UPI00336A62B5